MILFPNKAVCVCIPKTGCTSLRAAFGTPSCEPWDYHKSLTRIKLENELDLWSFCFVRNPLDRLVSLYHDFKQRGIYYSERITRSSPCLSEFTSFEQFVLELPNSLWVNDLHFWPQFEFVKKNSYEVGVDFIGRFTHIQEDLDKICEMKGIPKVKLPHLRKTNHRSYEAYYSSEMVDMVEEIYQMDFILLSDYF